MVRTTPEVDLSLTDWLVLGVLAEEPRHGFAVARELAPGTELGSIWTVRRPLVYRALDHLIDAGLADPIGVEPGIQGPHRTVIASTRAGRARLARWLSQPVSHPRDVRAVLLAKLALLTRRHQPIAPLAHAQRAVVSEVLEGLEQKRRHSEGVDQLALQWRVAANRSILAFLNTLIRDEQHPRSTPAASR